MAGPYVATRRVEFRDTDAAGIMHFSTFFTYMEEAEHELLRQLGLSVKTTDAEGVISWPRVAASCQYRGAAWFEDLLEIEVRVGRVGTKSVTYQFRFRRAGEELAVGEMTAVCCRMEEGRPPRSIPIPGPFAEKLQTLVASPD